MSEEIEKSESPVNALAEEWKELMDLHVRSELPDRDFKRSAYRLHGKIYNLINDPKATKIAEDLLEKVYGDVGKDFFDEEKEG